MQHQRIEEEKKVTTTSHVTQQPDVTYAQPLAQAVLIHVQQPSQQPLQSSGQSSSGPTTHTVEETVTNPDGSVTKVKKEVAYANAHSTSSDDVETKMQMEKQQRKNEGAPTDV